MSILIVEVYDALIDAGASEPKARAAASTLAAYDDRLNRIERRLTLLTWQVGGIYALLAPLVWLVLRIAAKVGALS